MLASLLRRSNWHAFSSRKVKAMKSYVLSGSTLAVALAVAAPVWAQTPSSQSSPGGAPSSTAPYSQSAPSATAPSPYTPSAPSTLSQSPMPPSSSSATTSAPYSTTENAAEPKRGRHVIHRAHRGQTASHMQSAHGKRHASGKARAPSDNVADQLNQQELGRVSGSSTVPTGNAAPASPQGGQSSGRGY